MPFSLQFVAVEEPANVPQISILLCRSSMLQRQVGGFRLPFATRNSVPQGKDMKSVSCCRTREPPDTYTFSNSAHRKLDVAVILFARCRAETIASTWIFMTQFAIASPTSPSVAMRLQCCISGAALSCWRTRSSVKFLYSLSPKYVTRTASSTASSLHVGWEKAGVDARKNPPLTRIRCAQSCPSPYMPDRRLKCRTAIVRKRSPMNSPNEVIVTE